MYVPVVVLSLELELERVFLSLVLSLCFEKCASRTRRIL